MTRQRLLVGVTLVVGLLLVAATVWLSVTSVQTAAYPPLQLDGRTVAGAYSLTEVRGDRVGAATVCAVAAVAALAWCASAIRAASRR
ncbi:hypothetical protein [Williamsia serinedens]|uniref:Uncharacterized protein n=1 Tax=Williamsia serinedens TaxID=391736 RepID=A0ABT1H3L8_9NOCA|nr:hypothetical protein [Williamsia serinedens]MCP2161839.1 hypothetical protein [Williamsia serinedens]